MMWRRVEFPLFTDHVEATRFTYAVFLLNKDLEQLLNAHGILAVVRGVCGDWRGGLLYPARNPF
jgi:hypothetical protein